MRINYEHPLAKGLAAAVNDRVMWPLQPMVDLEWEDGRHYKGPADSRFDAFQTNGGIDEPLFLPPNKRLFLNPET